MHDQRPTGGGPPPYWHGGAVPPVPPPPELGARRWTARLVDWVVPLGVSSLIWPLSVRLLGGELTDTAFRAPVAGAAGLAGGGWSGAGGALLGLAGGLMGTFATVIVMTLLVQLVAVAAYDVVCHRVWGRTLGKFLTGLAVRPYEVDAPGAVRLGTGSALARAALVVALPGVGWVLLVAAVLSLNVLFGLLGAAALLFSVIENASLRWSPSGRRSAHDRWTRTVVVPVSRTR